MKTLGILGGMGPLATAYVYNQIIENTCVHSDQEHIPIILYSNPKIPDRSSYILDQSKTNPLLELKKGVKFLSESGVDIIYITCNTAHYFYEELSNITRIEIINMPKITLDIISKKYPQKKVVLLATQGTYVSKIYEKNSEFLNVEFIDIDKETRKHLMDIIIETKNYGKTSKSLLKLKKIMKKYSNEDCIFVLGCTELSIYQYDLKKYFQNIIDASSVVSKYVIEKMGYKLKQKS